MDLQPLRCGSCAAAVPLGDGRTVTCPYCQAKVPVPPRYRKLLAERSREKRLQRELEFSGAATPPPGWLDALGVALVLLLPAAAATTWMSLVPRSVDTVALFSFAIVPALLPGAGVWLWSAAVHATIVKFQAALACAAPEREGGPGTCRECGAPLDVEPDAISAHCPYCDTDNLVVDVSEMTRRIENKLGMELRTLDQAARALRLRRRLLVVGSTLAMVLLGLVLFALAFAYRHVFDIPLR